MQHENDTQTEAINDNPVEIAREERLIPATDNYLPTPRARGLPEELTSSTSHEIPRIL